MTDKLKAKQLMTVEGLVSLIASRVHEASRDHSYTADKVRKRLKYAIKHGVLSSPTGDGRYELGTVMAWAWTKHGWVGKLDGLPRIVTDTVEERLTVTCTAIGTTTERDAINQLLVVTQRIADLEQENAQLAAKVAVRDSVVAKQLEAAKKKRRRIH